MSSTGDLRPGDLGFGPLNTHAVKLLVDAGQLLLGEGFTIGALRIEHVFVVTEAFIEADPAAHAISGAFDVPIDLVAPRGPRAVEAMPSGAREWSIADRWTDEYAYVRIPEDYAGQGEDAAAIARAMIGTPYSFASYAALAAWRFGLKTPRLERWIGRRGMPVPVTRHEPLHGVIPGYAETYGGSVQLPAEAICSVLADQAWSLTGKKVMHGVAHQCVTPGALARTLLEMPGAQWFWPGRDS